MEWYQRAEGAEAAQMDDEWVILHTEQFTVTKVNATGVLCWSLLSKAQTAASLSKELCLHCVVSKESAERDVGLFLQEMMEIGLVQYAGQ